MGWDPSPRKWRGFFFLELRCLLPCYTILNERALYICTAMGRILGVDYGLRRTGLSVTDPAQIIVQGLDTQESSKVFDFIVAYASKEPVDEIVVGYPFVEGAWGDKKFKEKLDQFILDLKKTFPDKVISLYDERNTSVDAREIMNKIGLKKHQRRDKALLDRTSAILILQEYLGHI